MGLQYTQYGSQNPETVLLLHGGGLSWWNFRDAAQLLADRFHVILPILDGHAGSDAPFVSIEDNAARIIAFIDAHFGGKIHTLGGLSLGGQIAAEVLAQRPDICRFALIESAPVLPAKLTRLLIRPAFGMSYGLIHQKWFARLQAAELKIPDRLFDDYFRDTCGITKENMIAFLECNCSYGLKPALRDTRAKLHILYAGKEPARVRRSAQLLHRTVPGSTLQMLPGLHHGQLSLCQPEVWAQLLLDHISP